jgi:hypothetical protein
VISSARDEALRAHRSVRNDSPHVEGLFGTLRIDALVFTGVEKEMDRMRFTSVSLERWQCHDQR